MKKKVLIGAGMVALAAFLAYVPFAFADRTMMHRDGMMGGGPGMAFFGHLLWREGSRRSEGVSPASSREQTGMVGS